MENVKGLLEELENERKKIAKKSRIFYALAFVFMILGMALCFFVHPLFMLLIFIGVILLVVIMPQVNKFKKKFKGSVVSAMIKEELGSDAVYRQSGGIPIEEINALGVAAEPDRHYEEDYITCTYNDIPYEMCDCTLQERVVTHDSKGNRQVTYETYFKGRVIKIDFQRDLNMELKVVNNATRGFKYKPLLPFETELIEFNKKFKCYASSKEDGFYILTPMLIQKMLELENKFKGGMYYVIKHNNLYVLINNSGDSLEVNIHKALDEKQLNKIRADILIGASIINEFRMDKDKYNVNR